ncbi:MAG: translocation/assembly module TamB domain-containing protein [Candidatus Eisenbacteria bacterium]
MRPKRSPRQTWLRRFGVVVFASFGAVSVFLVILTLGPGERLLKRLAEKYLSALLGQEVSIGYLETNLASRLEIADLAAYQVQDADRVHSLQIRSVRMDYELSDLIRRRVTIHSLNVDGLSLTIRKDSLGTYDFPFLERDEAGDTSAAEGSAFTVVLSGADLTDSRFLYLDESHPHIEALAMDINAEVSGDGNNRYIYRVGIDTVTTQYSDIAVGISDIELVGAWAPSRLQVHSVKMLLPNLSVVGQAEILQDGGPGSLSGRIHIMGDPGALVRRLVEQVADTTIAIGGQLDLALNLEGSMEEPRARCDLKIAGLDIENLHVPEVRVRASARPESIGIDELQVEIFGGQLVARAGILLDSLLSFEASVLMDGIDIRQVQQMVSPGSPLYDGRIKGRVTASGRARILESWAVSGDLAVEQPVYKRTPVPSVAIQLRYKNGDGDFELRQGKSIIAGKVAIKERSIDGRFIANIPELEPLVGMFIPDLAGRVELRGRVHGPLDSLLASVDIKSASIQYRNFPVDTIRGAVHYDVGVISLSDLRFAGSLAWVDTLAPPFGLRGLTGSLEYQGYVSGPLDSPSGDVRASSKGFQYGKTRLDQGNLWISLDNRRIDLKALEIRRDSLLVKATGSYRIASSAGEVAVEVYEMSSDIKDSTEMLGEDLYEFGERGDHGELAGKVVTHFDLSDESDIAALLVASSINLRSLYSIVTGDTAAAGTLNLTGHVSGPLRRPEARVVFNVSAPGYGPVSIDSLTGVVNVADSELRLERLKAHLGEKTYTVAATLALDASPSAGYTASEESAFKGWARGDDLDLRFLSPLLSRHAGVDGLMSYDLRWDGTLRAPRPEGMISLEGGGLRVKEGVPAVTDVNMAVVLMDSVLSVDRLMGNIKDTPFNVQARIVSRDWREFALDAKVSLAAYGQVTALGTLSPESLDLIARIDHLGLEVFEPLSSAVTRLLGTLTADIFLVGPVKAPRIRGTMVIRGLYLESPEFSPPLTDGVVKLRFQDTVVGIDSVFARVGEGSVLASGSLSHHNGQLSEISVVAKVSRLNFTRPKVFVALVESADLRYAGRENRYLLDGDVVMGESRFVMDFDPKSILPFARSVRKPEQELPAVLSETSFDVRLRDSKDLWVDNNVARIRSHAELNLVGSPSQPSATGRVSVEEGYVKFLDRKFEIARGTVDFVERDRLNPMIDLRAQSRVRAYKALQTTAYTVNLDIAGSLDEVRVDLTSDPPLDRSNILSLLTLGVTRDQLAGPDNGGPTTGEVLRVRAEELTGRVVSGYVTRSVADLMGLKDLSIEGNLFNPRGDQGAFLVASKDLYERVEVTYSTNIGHFNENRIRMDYRLSRRFSLQGETDQRGNAGIDLKYKVKFR